MSSSIERCFHIASERTDDLIDVLSVINLIAAAYALIANCFAFHGIWLIYKSDLTRTPKLLLFLFAINIVTTIAVALLPIYHIIDTYFQSWFFSLHIILIVILVLWSSSNCCLVSIDRYFIVKHGSQYRLWKKYFHVLYFGEIFIISSYAIYLYISLQFMDCTTNKINFSSIAVFISLNMALSIFSNLLLTTYLKNNISLAGRIHNLDRSIIKSVMKMTFSDLIFQLVQVSTMITYGCVVIFSTKLSVYSNFIVYLLAVISVFHCGIVPLYYILINERVLKIFCCENS